MRKKISNILKNILLASILIFLFSFSLGGVISNTKTKEDASEEIDDCSHDHEQEEKLANVETDEILDDVKNATSYKICDNYGTYWIITFDSDDNAIMTYSSGTKSVYVPAGATYTGLDLNTNKMVSFTFCWGSGSLAYCNGATLVKMHEDVGSMYIKNYNDKPEYENKNWCANATHTYSVNQGVVSNATCEAAQMVEYKCAYCSQTTVRANGSALGHNTSRTGTFYGFSYATCSRDGWALTNGRLRATNLIDEASTSVTITIPITKSNATIYVAFSVISEENYDYLNIYLKLGNSVVGSVNATGEDEGDEHGFNNLAIGTYTLVVSCEKDDGGDADNEYYELEAIYIAEPGYINLPAPALAIPYGTSTYSFSFTSSTISSISVRSSNSNVTANRSGNNIILTKLNNLAVGSSFTVTISISDYPDHTPVTSSIDINIVRATPTITTKPTAPSMTYGNALSAYALTGGVASVAGKFAWTNSSTKPLAATSSASVTFTPTDTTNYNTVTFSISISVARLRITVPTTKNTTYNGSSQSVTSLLSNYSSTYVSISGTTSATNAGTYSVTFSLKDTANLCWPDTTTSAKSASWTIAKATPSITTKPTAPSMTYSHSLSEYTLSGGAASVSGKFAWTSGSTEPNVADKTANVTFTPTDTANYNTITFSISISVAKLVIQVPTVTQKFVFKNDVQGPKLYNEWYSISGNDDGYDAGIYYVILKLDDKDNTIWSTNTTDNQTIKWEIEKATPKIYTEPEVKSIT